MATTSVRSIVVSMSGDVSMQGNYAAANNTSAPGEIRSITLASGANTITPPTGAKGAILVPPSANTTSITFKGVSGDTGLRLHNTDPAVITLNAATDTFVLTAGAEITGFRIIWT